MRFFLHKSSGVTPEWKSGTWHCE